MVESMVVMQQNFELEFKRLIVCCYAINSFILS